jgi:hypothetical protein
MKSSISPLFVGCLLLTMVSCGGGEDDYDWVPCDYHVNLFNVVYHDSSYVLSHDVEPLNNVVHLLAEFYDVSNQLVFRDTLRESTTSVAFETQPYFHLDARLVVVCNGRKVSQVRQKIRNPITNFSMSEGGFERGGNGLLMRKRVSWSAPFSQVSSYELIRRTSTGDTSFELAGSDTSFVDDFSTSLIGYELVARNEVDEISKYLSAGTFDQYANLTLPLKWVYHVIPLDDMNMRVIGMNETDELGYVTYDLQTDSSTAFRRLNPSFEWSSLPQIWNLGTHSVIFNHNNEREYWLLNHADMSLYKYPLSFRTPILVSGWVRNGGLTLFGTLNTHTDDPYHPTRHVLNSDKTFQYQDGYSLPVIGASIIPESDSTHIVVGGVNRADDKHSTLVRRYHLRSKSLSDTLSKSLQSSGFVQIMAPGFQHFVLLKTSKYHILDLRQGRVMDAPASAPLIREAAWMEASFVVMVDDLGNLYSLDLTNPTVRTTFGKIPYLPDNRYRPHSLFRVDRNAFLLLSESNKAFIGLM